MAHARQQTISWGSWGRALIKTVVDSSAPLAPLAPWGFGGALGHSNIA